MQPPYIYRATITNVVDGDTFDAVVDLGFNVQTRIRFRLLGLDTAELNSADVVQRELATKAKQLLSTQALNQQATIHSHKADKYGRWLAELFIDGQSLSMNNRLLAEGLAKPYFGGTRGQ